MKEAEKLKNCMQNWDKSAFGIKDLFFKIFIFITYKNYHI